jgi:hypothetical protein
MIGNLQREQAVSSRGMENDAGKGLDDKGVFGAA